LQHTYNTSSYYMYLMHANTCFTCYDLVAVVYKHFHPLFDEIFVIGAEVCV
jgi:hypothetical protein